MGSNKLLTNSGPARNAAAVTPSDTVNIREAKLYVGGAGDLVVTLADMPDGTSETFFDVPVGWQPIEVKRVWAGTTATNIVAVWS